MYNGPMDYLQEPEQVRITQIITASLLGMFAGIFAILFATAHLRELASIASGTIAIAAIIAVVYYTQKLGETLQTRKELQ